MELNKEQILHIAKLARLDLTEEEIGRFQGELSKILGYIDQLAEVDTDNVEPTAQVTGKVNAFRADEARSWAADEREAAIMSAPAREDRQYKVKKVL